MINSELNKIFELRLIFMIKGCFSQLFCSIRYNMFFFVLSFLLLTNTSSFAQESTSVIGNPSYRFDYYLLNEILYIDGDDSKGIGYYQELLSKEEIDNPDRKEQLITDNEELNALDIDDYDIDDDIDNSAEALDGYDD